MRLILALFISAVTGATTSAHAESGDLVTTCKSGDRVRRVMVVYAQAGRKAPCQVIYDKQTEKPGKPEILYEANSSRGFCEKKAEEFLASKMKGWSCEGDLKAAAKPESKPEAPKD
jgi:hypothetical protein